MDRKSVSKEQYLMMAVVSILYTFMLTKLFFTLDIDSRALIDVIFYSTPDKILKALSFLPNTHLGPYYMQVLIDSFFIVSFYPLLISLFLQSPTIITVVTISGLADIIENGFSLYFFSNRIFDQHLLTIGSLVTNIKFLFLLITLLLIGIKLVNNLRKKG